MRLLLDTHAFLWFVAGDDRLSHTARSAIEDRGNERLLSVASAWEIAIKASLGRLVLKLPLAEFIQRHAIENQISLFPITLPQLSELANLPFHHRDPFDRLIVAQSREGGLELVSNDAWLEAYGVRRVW